ncbi:hypothetical protein KSD_57440 [Ktedonobacter sp. SOSP1-85]|uniref:hypothetical protein n=1 Tax=Ktedonobacter sp. SOSP1-85 TaxID=2778367 RepID=UPI0019155C06|nr:hypothetical protein [Ktedonobacter sp. SOSP1-85]GHO77973.1 hypothetical protein KSD_57440 [Ktedonobacter sp. SOSP1-85]
MHEAQKKGEDTSGFIYVAALFLPLITWLFFLSNLISLPDKIENSHSPIFSIIFTIQTYLTLILGPPTEVALTLSLLGRTKLVTKYFAFFGIPASTAEPSDAEEALQPGRDQL